MRLYIVVITVVFVSLLSASISQAELSDGLRAYIDKVETYRWQAMKAHRKTLRSSDVDEAARRNARGKIAQITKTHTLEFPEKFVAPSLSREPKVGDIGQVEGARVNRIIDDATMLVEATETYRWGNRWLTRPTGTYLVKGVPTDGLADGRSVKLPKTMTITGTEQRGVKTYFILEPLDLDGIRKDVDAYLKTRPKRPIMP
jgi:hypothetical protein